MPVVPPLRLHFPTLQINSGGVQAAPGTCLAWSAGDREPRRADIIGSGDQPIGVAQTRREPGPRGPPGTRRELGPGPGGRRTLHPAGRGLAVRRRGGRAQRRRGAIHHTRSAELRLPAHVAARIRAGEELGPVMDELLGTVDIKRGVGTVGAFTLGLVTRPQVWQQAVALALAPLLTPDLYRS